MRVVMIHAVAESIPPVKLAFQEEYPEAEVVNLLDEGLLLDFGEQLTPKLRRRMSQVICYAAEYGADAVGLACSVYAPVVDIAKDLVDVPVVSSYGPVIAEAVAAGPRIGVIATVNATLRDSEFYLRQAAQELGVPVEPHPCLAEDLIPVLRQEGPDGFRRRLGEEVSRLAPEVDAILLGQFSMALALDHLRSVSPVPVLSPPHSSARKLKELLSASQ
jgi:Asp/Glu/hydantoin racemase